jgi:hypothetical protein
MSRGRLPLPRNEHRAKQGNDPIHVEGSSPPSTGGHSVLLPWLNDNSPAARRTACAWWVDHKRNYGFAAFIPLDGPARRKDTVLICAAIQPTREAGSGYKRADLAPDCCVPSLWYRSRALVRVQAFGSSLIQIKNRISRARRLCRRFGRGYRTARPTQISTVRLVTPEVRLPGSCGRTPRHTRGANS